MFVEMFEMSKEIYNKTKLIILLKHPKEFDFEKYFTYYKIEMSF